MHGNSFRMSELHAALGLAQLSSFGSQIRRLNEIARLYRALLEDVPEIELAEVTAGHVISGHKVIVFCSSAEDRRQLTQHAAQNEIFFSRGVYEYPLDRHPVFAKLDFEKQYPVAADFSERHLCLPIWKKMTDAEVERVALCIRAFFRKEKWHGRGR